MKGEFWWSSNNKRRGVNFGRGSGQQYVLMPIYHMNTPLPDSDLKTGGLSICQPNIYHVHYGGLGKGFKLYQSEPVTTKSFPALRFPWT